LSSIYDGVNVFLLTIVYSFESAFNEPLTFDSVWLKFFSKNWS